MYISETWNVTYHWSCVKDTGCYAERQHVSLRERILTEMTAWDCPAYDRESKTKNMWSRWPIFQRHIPECEIHRNGPVLNVLTDC